MARARLLVHASERFETCGGSRPAKEITIGIGATGLQGQILSTGNRIEAIAAEARTDGAVAEH
jgi:hypothetical protein